MVCTSLLMYSSVMSAPKRALKKIMFCSFSGSGAYCIIAYSKMAWKQKSNCSIIQKTSEEQNPLNAVFGINKCHYKSRIMSKRIPLAHTFSKPVYMFTIISQAIRLHVFSDAGYSISKKIPSDQSLTGKKDG